MSDCYVVSEFKRIYANAFTKYFTKYFIDIILCLIFTSRPCAMVVPDFELICEIMLVAEGFLDARLLARKFITLYSLCKELLSKQVELLIYLLSLKVVLFFSATFVFETI